MGYWPRDIHPWVLIQALLEHFSWRWKNKYKGVFWLSTEKSLLLDEAGSIRDSRILNVQTDDNVFEITYISAVYRQNLQNRCFKPHLV